MDAKLTRMGASAFITLVACTASRGGDSMRYARPRFTPAVRASVAPRCTLRPMSPSAVASSGGSLALSPAEDLAAAVDTDNDRVLILGLARGSVTSERAIAVGRQPMQAAISSDGRLFVTERGDRSASVYDIETGRRLCKTDAGRDPVGIALAPDQRLLLVTSGIDHKATAIDTETFATRFVVSVPREPRGVAVTPDGKRALVAHIAGEPLSAIELLPDATQRAIALPHPPIVGDNGEEDLRPPFARRSAGLELTPLTEIERDGLRNGVLSVEDVPRSPIVRPFASQAWSVAIDRVGARVVVPFMVSRTGNDTLANTLDPSSVSDEYGSGTAGRDGERVSFALGVFNAKTLQWDSVTQPPRAFDARPVRVPSGVALGADGEVYVTSMGTDVVARIDEVPSLAETTPTVNAPCGIAATRDGVVLVFSPFEHTLQIDRRHRRPPVEPARAPTSAPTLGSCAALTQEPDAVAQPLEVEYLSFGADTLDPVLAQGRRLFHSAGDSRIAAGGFSCAGCHPDGRDDGLVWFLPGGARQTPTLAGRLEHPFNWNGTHDALDANIAQTIHRLGGTGLAPSEVAALAAYILRGLPTPARDERPLTTAETRGRALFEGSADCDGCHAPERNFTDGARHRFRGAPFPETSSRFDTPSLTFVGSTAPYFHDGRYATLREMLASRRHQMGNAATLAASDMEALEAYLQTL